MYPEVSRTLSFIRAILGLPPLVRYKLRCQSVRTIAIFLEESLDNQFHEYKKIALDMGCGITPRNPFKAEKIFGVDITETADNNVLKADLATEKIPYGEESFDCVSAFDFIEHIPRVSSDNSTRFPFVELMNEVHRVLRPGGYFFCKTPAFPFSEAFRDPTHVNIITEETFPWYFCKNDGTPLARSYGFNGRFDLVSQKWWGGAWLLTLVRKK